RRQDGLELAAHVKQATLILVDRNGTARCLALARLISQVVERHVAPPQKMPTLPSTSEPVAGKKRGSLFRRATASFARRTMQGRHRGVEPRKPFGGVDGDRSRNAPSAAGLAVQRRRWES